MECLHYIKKYGDCEYDAFADTPNHVQDNAEYAIWEREKERRDISRKETVLFVNKKAKRARHEIDKHIDMNPFIIRTDALRELIKWRIIDKRKFMEDDDPEVLIEEKKKMMDECILSLQRIARANLEAIIDKLMDKFKGFLQRRKS